MTTNRENVFYGERGQSLTRKSIHTGLLRWERTLPPPGSDSPAPNNPHHSNLPLGPRPDSPSCLLSQHHSLSSLCLAIGPDPRSSYDQAPRTLGPYLYNESISIAKPITKILLFLHFSTSVRMIDRESYDCVHSYMQKKEENSEIRRNGPSVCHRVCTCNRMRAWCLMIRQRRCSVSCTRKKVSLIQRTFLWIKFVHCYMVKEKFRMDFRKGHTLRKNIWLNQKNYLFETLSLM